MQPTSSTKKSCRIKLYIFCVYARKKYSYSSLKLFERIKKKRCTCRSKKCRIRHVELLAWWFTHTNEFRKPLPRVYYSASNVARIKAALCSSMYSFTAELVNKGRKKKSKNNKKFLKEAAKNTLHIKQNQSVLRGKSRKKKSLPLDQAHSASMMIIMIVVVW